MITLIGEWSDRFFPELQIWFRRDGRITYRNLSSTRQIAAIAALACVLVLIAYLGCRFLHFGHVVLLRNQAVTQANSDVAFLTEELTRLRATSVAAENRADLLGQRHDQLAEGLAAAQRQLAELERERDEALAHARRSASELQAERNRLLSQQNANQNEHEPSPSMASGFAPAKLGATTTNTSPSATGMGSRVAALLASTGLGIERLLGDIGGSNGRAEGGPFVPLGDAMTTDEKARREKLLEAVVKALPLSAPLDHYLVTSSLRVTDRPLQSSAGVSSWN